MSGVGCGSVVACEQFHVFSFSGFTASALPLIESFPICLYDRFILGICEGANTKRRENGSSRPSSSWTAHSGVEEWRCENVTTVATDQWRIHHLTGLFFFFFLFQFDALCSSCDGNFFLPPTSQVGSTLCKASFPLRAVQIQHIIIVWQGPKKDFLKIYIAAFTSQLPILCFLSFLFLHNT